MKKLIIPTIIITIITSLALFVKNNASKVESDTKNLESSPIASVEILKEDLDKIESRLTIEDSKKNIWQDLNNYSKKPEEIVTLENKMEYMDFLNRNMVELKSCIKKDFCGMEKLEGKAYFDDEKTPAHILLARELEILKNILKLDSKLTEKVDWNLISDLSLMKSPIVQNIALDLLRNFDQRNNGAEKLLKMTQEYKGELKAKLFLNLMKDSLPNERRILINAFKDSFSKDDAHTVISILEKIEKMNFKKDELLEILPYLCRFKESELQAHNLKTISMHVSRLNMSIKEICP